MKSRISILIPCHNEAGTIEQSYHRLTDFLRGKYNYEIILEEDGSSDGTDEIICRIAEKDSRVTALTFPGRRRGKGWGLRKCFRAARGDLIIVVDAELPISTAVIERFVDESRNADIIIGSRFLRSGSHRPRYRDLLSKGYNLLSRMLFELNTTDIQCGYKLIKREVLNSIELRLNGFEMDTELVVKARSKGFRIKEIPVDWIQRRDSKVNVLTQSVRMLFGLVVIKLWELLEKQKF